MHTHTQEKSLLKKEKEREWAKDIAQLGESACLACMRPAWVQCLAPQAHACNPRKQGELAFKLSWAIY